jgi:flap endonuclease-1
MGIKSLTKLIKAKSPGSIETSQYHKLSGKRIAIDASLYIYQCLMNVRHDGKYLTNDDDKVTSHISGLFYKNINLLSMNITPIYIFDGKPPDEKYEVIKLRQEKAKIAKTELKNAKLDNNCSDNTKNKLEKKSIRLTKTHIDDVKHLLNLMGIQYLHMDGEGEALASELCRIGYVDYVMTEDMDTLPFGCPKLIRNCLDRSQKRNDLISIISLDKILEDLNIDYNKFVELCILCGCDYCQNIPRVGIVKALTIIKTFDNIEDFLNSKHKYVVPDNYLECFKKSKQLFTMYHGNLNPEKLDFHKSSLNIAELMKYLIHDCNISEKRVHTAIKKIQQSY